MGFDTIEINLVYIPDGDNVLNERNTSPTDKKQYSRTNILVSHLGQRTHTHTDIQQYL